ncbi:ABC transporter permease [Massiliimalia timonensis]|uniref:ABC transporter permease n=2 Tax=Massiliimalia timonensis TaxID=1987501 RepID=UPI000B8ADC22|nr:ABC transporter permease [Massiliimalia timonensis]
MLTKLAFKNLGKSVRDYAVYFLTLVLGVSIFYMFNSIYAQQELMKLSESTVLAISSMTELLSYISAFIAVILGFLIVYANNFFIKRRKKELGVYMTLGMTRKSISIIFLLETSLMAIFALAVGLILGVFGSQFMSIFTANIFEVDLTEYKFIFSLDAALKSVLYFVVIFFVVALFNVIVINKVKLIDLLYGGRKNETLKIKNTMLSAGLFLVSVILLIIAYCLIFKFDFGPTENSKYLKGAIILGAIGTFLFFFALAGFFIKLLQSRKKLYYKNLNIFVVRQLSSKMNTNFISVSMVCLVLFLVIVVFSAGYSAQNILSAKLQQQAAYDFSLEGVPYHPESDTEEGIPEIFNNLPEELQNSGEIKNHAEYTFFNMEGSGGEYGDYNLDLSVLDSDISGSSLYFMKLSDYNQLRQINGATPCSLPDNEYLIAYEDSDLSVIADQFVDKKIAITIGTNTMNAKMEAERFTFGNRYFGGIVFVVNDDWTSALQIQRRVLNINCKDEAAASALQKKIYEFINNQDEKQVVVRYDSKQDIYASSVSDKALASFLSLYLSFVFMITCAAILAIQQLSEAADNKERYQLLRKLGTEKKMMNKALFTQILCYFLIPLALAIVHSLVGLKVVYTMLNEFGNINVLSSIIATAAFIIVIYGAYFILTYVGSKNIVKK